MSSEVEGQPKETSIVYARDIGKCYRIYDNPKARIKQALWRGRRQYFREFWAVRHISFDVRRGESLGIVGRNGSGKSTLLQLICGTLTPTEGTLRTKGRVAALLELGSGFNPEFTGLENVYLNASLLGLSKAETDQRLEAILGFADIGDFIHQPVKAYSSGMAVRLAFAVIAHVDADILVVDEALAVGDAIFMQRCMRFIRRMREERCLLFVSHDAEAVKNLCSHALWLNQGSVQAYGDCRSVTLDYLRFCQAKTYGEETQITPIGAISSPSDRQEELVDPDHEELSSDLKGGIYDYMASAKVVDNLLEAKGWKTGEAELLEVGIKPLGEDMKEDVLQGGEKVEVTIKAITHRHLRNPILGFIIKDRLGQDLFGENTLVKRRNAIQESADAGDEIWASFQLWFPMLPNGTYTLMASIADGDLGLNTQHHWVDDAKVITVSSSKVKYGLIGAFITNIQLAIRRHASPNT
jgi:lipopolysaccharide transport system ATP-binding protein